MNVARGDGLLLGFISGVASKFKDFAGEVLEDGSGKGTGSDTYLLGIAALPEHAGASGDWECQVGFFRAIDALSLLAVALSRWHCFFLFFSNY